MTNYRLDTYKKGGDKKDVTPMHTTSMWQSTKEFYVYLHGDGALLATAFVAVLLTSIAGVVTPYLIARTIDRYVATSDVHGLGLMSLGLLGLYVFTAIAGYVQSRLMGYVSRRTLFRLRAALFSKLQDLPIAFFNQNKAGDLMSRLNNDTDKLNQFLSESIVRLAGSFFVVFGIAAFVLVVNVKMGAVMLAMTLFIIIVTKLMSPRAERENAKALQALGGLSASLQENLTNFRVIVAYSKRAYFKKHLQDINSATFTSNFIAQTINKLFEPLYDFAGVVSLILVLAYGIHLISLGALTVGLLVAFISYTQKFYEPLRALATIFGTVQLSLAAWSRVRVIFNMENDLVVLPDSTADIHPTPHTDTNHVHRHIYRMEFKKVNFGYVEGTNVLDKVDVVFEQGKTYAFVGPTGGGKSTLVSLMDRLYDPQSGVVLLDGKDIRTYPHARKAELISVILQDPLLFGGTVGDNVRYGNDNLASTHDSELEKVLTEQGLGEVVARFDKGLATPVTQSTGSGLSLGQKQLISFMRAVLRRPQILILDEATANIDTVTEFILQKALDALPEDTTKVIIAHRLNTIKKADQILFVNGGRVTPAGDVDHAIELIENSKRKS